MAGLQNLPPTFSDVSTPASRSTAHAVPSAAGASASQQVSTTTLLNSLHTTYSSKQPLLLETSTSLVVNSLATAAEIGPDGRYGGIVDVELGRRAWEHARRRAEDSCIILSSLHESTPTLFAPLVSALPFFVPPSFYTAVNVIRSFTHCVTPHNPSFPRYSSLGAKFTLSLAGSITGASLSLSSSGIDTKRGLLDIPAEPGYRAFDVFYYLITGSSSSAEREYLNLKAPSAYSLLKRSGTYQPPQYLPTADDAASAEEFRANLKAIGIRGSSQRNLISVLVGLLKLGDIIGPAVSQSLVGDICDEVASLLDIETDFLARKLGNNEREALIAGLYEVLVDWVISRANEAIRQDLRGAKPAYSSSGSEPDDSGDLTPPSSEDEDGDSVCINVIDIPSPTLGKAIALRTVFDDSQGINAEMKEDGVPMASVGSSVIREMNNALGEVEAELSISTITAAAREREHERDRRDNVLDSVKHEMENGCFLGNVLKSIRCDATASTKGDRFDLTSIVNNSRVWFHLCLHPSDDQPSKLVNVAAISSIWSAGSVSQQLRSWRLPEWANRRNKCLDFTADFDIEEFIFRYSKLGCKEGKDGVETWIIERGWSNGEIVLGHERVWLREAAWWEAETMLDMKAAEADATNAQSAGDANGFFAPSSGINHTSNGSRDNLLRQHSSATLGAHSVADGKTLAAGTQAPSRNISGGDYGLGNRGDDKRGITYYNEMDVENGDPNVVTEQPISFVRRAWVGLVWALTFWIPSSFLRFVGRMKRPDVQMAWREKLVIIIIIFFLNAIIVFYIIWFGRLLCPRYDKAWTEDEVSTHRGDSDFWVSHRGKVYDISKFWKRQHSDTNIKTTAENMEPLAGLNLDRYIEPPLELACPGLVEDDFIILQHNETVEHVQAIHASGPRAQTDPESALNNKEWYTRKFLPKMRDYEKGDLVHKKGDIKSEGEDNNRPWVIIDERVYDLTDYFYTAELQNNRDSYHFLDEKVEELFEDQPGSDVTDEFNKLDLDIRTNNLNCLDNAFYVGQVDFRESPQCKVNEYILLTFTVILCSVILIKFLAALQLGSKRRPVNQDRFVICQVPAYTEGEDQLRKGLDSLTALQYDNKRKLIFVICDGMIVGGGNDRPTPKIALDILGVDPKIDPPALPFRSIGNGSEQLNYGKVYSGLYEYEGNVVPYIVVVKVGKESEQTKPKPGNRGKRDSQVLLMRFLNRVHHRSPMSPLELEIFHQINNVIGVDPELYEYLMMVDADTTVKEDSLNRLVASCAHDAKIAGICGETSLQNEERSWWTMIQVYEYYISHHLAKAFESLFASVTCLPGCFCMYRLRSSDKGRPLIISDKVIDEYSDCHVDTLHKKNLLSLGEDRYLTTLMTKHFPKMSYKFIPDAYASTAAPESWSVLLSQRRRWINSTIHNLGELFFLKDLCGFCCFSMRFVIFLDLFGTIILPATCVYLGYLIYRVATNTGQLPLFSLIILAAVYGLQAIIFIVKRQWQHIGWMIIYILAFPIYSFILPIYSFWKQDDFSWGNTRVVIGEKGSKQVIATDDNEGFDPRSIPLQRWDDYAAANNLPGQRGFTSAVSEKGFPKAYEDNAYEMEDIRSVYSSVRPASTILTGFPRNGMTFMPPQSPGSMTGGMGAARQSGYSNFSQLSLSPHNAQHSRMTSLGNMSDISQSGGLGNGNSNYDLYSARQSRVGLPSMSNPFGTQSTPSLTANDNGLTNMGMGVTPNMGLSMGMNPQMNTSMTNFNNSNTMNNPNRARSPLGFPPTGGNSRPVSTINFQTINNGPSDEAIIGTVRSCLREVDLDTVTKKQLRALAEQRLQMQLLGDRKAFLNRQIDLELANM